jgi:hypothetical protein
MKLKINEIKITTTKHKFTVVSYQSSWDEETYNLKLVLGYLKEILKSVNGQIY